ncbi:calcium-binding protein [Conexibacter woesei]|uniref:Hemolysin-type calcium-binding region n=1 Tax=Conexibacter woesei (strain DSM 14684 / CCUG 47730 / CIP 108061 / JCM 11494 / NBRC 100937 / ID131577) TaxID=469383 RepID=D3F2K6_CONWI|nr:calcium-binding protein [Conexibacter woesei]ADB52272.1 Hemolysin-type calcium-binding region [Conexibacter woesei DSM 14684]
MRTVVLAGVVLMLSPVVAGAAQVGTTAPFCPSPRGCVDLGSVSVVAAPGERNVVTVTRELGGIVVVHDDGAPLVSAGDCSQVDSHTVRCPYPSVGILLGDGDDSALLATNAAVDGGPGDDRLRAEREAGYVSFIGGEGNDVLDATDPNASTLDGGPGDDVLSGSGGEDGLIGGAGDDQLSAARGNDFLTPGPGADDVDGGAGRDLFSHADRGTTPLTFALTDGRTGEDPRAVGIEDVIGGDGADRITGDDRPNLILGSGGNDDLAARGGDDEVDGDGGADTLDGGPGADHVYGRRAAWRGPLDSSERDGADRLRGGPGRDGLDGGPGADRLTCDGGFDHVAAGDGDRLPTPAGSTRSRGSDCERLNFRTSRSRTFFCLLPASLRPVGAQLWLTNPCRGGAWHTRAVMLRGADRTLLARGVAHHGALNIRLQPTRRGRRVLRTGTTREILLSVQTDLPRNRQHRSVRIAIRVG